MLLTNGQRGDVIDALKAAIDFSIDWIRNETLDGRTSPTSMLSPAEIQETRTQVKRWRALRRAYRVEEKEALADFANVRKALRSAGRKKRKGGA
jgi:hypothetical protein